MAGKKSKKGNVSRQRGAQRGAPGPSRLSVSSNTPSDTSKTNPDVKESGNEATPSTNSENKNAGQIHLYPVHVITQNRQKVELQLSPGDSVMDVRQFLLDAPRSCYFTCYDLLLHTKDGPSYHLEDYNEISDVADISTGECQLEMIEASYDDRSIRVHVDRTRELLSLSALHSSLSTSLGRLHEYRQSTCSNLGDPANIEVTDIDKMDFLANPSMSLPSMFVPPYEDIQCVQSLEYSSFNPPPIYRRLSGDLIYLDVVTLEGNKCCITGTTKLFYANITSGNILDPRPRKSASDATTLVGLLQKLSPMFSTAFEEVQTQRASAHPFENEHSLLPSNSWLEFNYYPEHKRDTARAENASTLPFGSELIGVKRDWNEELQSYREFPHSTYEERILRDRALHKINTDFVDAAINGAVGIIRRSIPPINQTDPEYLHIVRIPAPNYVVKNDNFYSNEFALKRAKRYVYNNIFFSYAFDEDIEKLPRRQVLDSTSDAETESAGLPLSSAEKDDTTEHQLATYASTNNDLNGTKAYQEADVSGLYTLAMAIIDYRGHRVLAQSIVPGILYGDKSDSLLYGSVDNGKKLFRNEEFHSKVAEAARRLHLKEHPVLDGSGNEFTLVTPVECKGILGSDDRHYLLDLTRVTPRDANYTEPGSRFSILRSELISAFCHVEAEKLNPNSESDAKAAVNSDESAVKSDSEGLETKGVEATMEVCDTESETKHAAHDIRFNLNVFAEVKLAGSPQEIAVDEELVRKVSSYLKDYVLPKFVSDLCTLEVSPMDGQTLTEALHENGINVRYIGKVAEHVRPLRHLWELCSNEVIVRSAKHILKDVLRDTEDLDLGHAIAHFFNCLFGNVASKVVADPTGSKSPKKDRVSPIVPVSSKNQGKTKQGAFSRKNQSSASLWSEIQEFAKLKYQFELEDEARSHAKKIPVIRNLCQKVGITIAARTYQLEDVAPFQVSDILDLRPVVKYAIPVTSEARDLVEHGKVHLAEGKLSEAYTSFSDGFTMIQQVTGPMHLEFGKCCRYLAMVLYHAGDMAGAITQQQNELIISERCLGLDHPDTAHSYANLALYYHGMNKTDLAIWHMNRALVLLSVSCGPDHPDVATTFVNLAMMYQDSGNVNEALRVLQKALEKNITLLGEEHIQTAVCYHAIAILYNSMSAYKLSRQREQKTYDILVKLLGEDDPKCQDSKSWIQTFTVRENQANAEKQKGQTGGKWQTSAQGEQSSAQGEQSSAQGEQCLAQGGQSSAQRQQSLAQGGQSSAQIEQSSAQGGQSSVREAIEAAKVDLLQQLLQEREDEIRRLKQVLNKRKAMEEETAEDVDPSDNTADQGTKMDTEE